MVCSKKTKENKDREGVFWKRGLFRNVLFLEILEKVEILEDLQTVENKGEADRFP